MQILICNLPYFSSDPREVIAMNIKKVKHLGKQLTDIAVNKETIKSLGGKSSSGILYYIKYVKF